MRILIKKLIKDMFAKNLLVYLIAFVVLLLAVLSIKGTKYIKLSKDDWKNFSKDFSKVEKIDVVSTAAGEEIYKWRGIYRNVFPITDPNKIKIIFKCIDDANSAERYTDRKICFKVGNLVYFLGIGWDHEKIYGDWWESETLLMAFKQWGFVLPKGEPNLPTGKIWKDGDPFLPPIPFEPNK